jgi:hypothetical protein
MKSTAPKWLRQAGWALVIGTSPCMLACSERALSEVSPLSQAKAALTALVERDAIAAAQCRDAVDRCGERVMGEAPAEVCARHAQRCDNLETRLSDARERAMECWQAVQACVEGATDRAQCHAQVAACELGDEGLSRARDPMLRCSERVEACLVRAAEVAESGAACAAIEASCSMK